jgi:hypothetical protein
MFAGGAPRFNSVSPAPMTAFSGGTFEASGVAYVPGTDGVLFVDDGRPNEIFWMRLGSDRKQSGAIETIDIATSIIDLEGITTDARISTLSVLSRSRRAPISLASPVLSSTQQASGCQIRKLPLDLKNFWRIMFPNSEAWRTRNTMTAA